MGAGAGGDRTILFTGFPGFLGLRLVPRLLEEKPDARIECLVQEKFLEVAREGVAAIARLFAGALGKSFLFVPVPMVVAKAAFRPIHGLIGMPLEALDYFSDPVRHDATVALRDLGALGLSCPHLADYTQALVAFYRAERDHVRREAMI